jgi:succinoglycan biosynthesis protein ExoA
MRVSVIIPALRCDAFLERTLRSIEAQELPADCEVEVVVGLAEPVPPQVPEGVRVVPNPSGAIPDALNRAFASSTGDYIVRVDSRCVLPRGYLQRVVEHLRRPEVGCVGGSQMVLDRGRFGSAYAVAFNSPLLGPSRYRYSRRSGRTDSPYLGSWRREVFSALDGFDGRMLRTEDNELAERVRAAGYLVLFDADLVVGYTADRGLPGSLLHHYAFGRWRRTQAAVGHPMVSPRQTRVIGVAVAAVAALLGALASGRLRGRAVRVGAVVYGACGLGAWHTARQLRMARPDLELAPLDPLGVALAPALAAAIDAAWLVGILSGPLPVGAEGASDRIVNRGEARGPSTDR